MIPLTPTDNMVIRLNEAMDHLDQANTIFNYVVFALSNFEGLEDPDWNHRLEAIVNVSRILERLPETTHEVIIEASREIAFNRLPMLLTVELVSAIETCLEDISRIRLAELHPEKSDEEIDRDLRRLFSGGPLNYLQRMADQLEIDYFSDDDWHTLIELSATRNVLVHRSEPVADERYVRNSGPAARVEVGEGLSVDNKYLMPRYVVMKSILVNLVQVIG